MNSPPSVSDPCRDKFKKMLGDEAKADTTEADMEESVGDMSIIQRAEMLRREVEERFLSQQKRMEVKQQVASDMECLASSKSDRLATASTGSAAFSRSKQAMAMAAEFCAPSPAWKSGLESWDEGEGGGGDEAADGELVDVSLDSLTGTGSEWQKGSTRRESGAAWRHPHAYASVIRPDLAEASAMRPDKNDLEAAEGMTTTERLDDEERCGSMSTNTRHDLTIVGEFLGLGMIGLLFLEILLFGAFITGKKIG